MKNSASQSSRSVLALAAALCLAGTLGAQSNGNSDKNNPGNGNGSKASFPAADTLVLLGQASTEAEAKPLIDQYYAEQETLFQERRAAILRMQGKTQLEQLQIMQALVESQQERRKKNKELEAKVSAMLKQDREKKQKEKTNNGNK